MNDGVNQLMNDGKFTRSVRVLRIVVLSLTMTISGGTIKAQAENTFWNWIFSGDSGSASGTFEVNSSNLIVGVTNGQVTDFINFNGPITSLLAPDAYFNDNIFNPAGPYLTGNGVAFETTQPFNLYYENGGYYMFDAMNPTSSGTFTAAISQ